jgi:hypothetical protein
MPGINEASDYLDDDENPLLTGFDDAIITADLEAEAEAENDAGDVE